LKSIQARPYKLFNQIQNYEWGTKNEDAFIPKFLGIDPVKDLPYGELWIGAHPKAASQIEIDGEKIKLNEAIEKFPNEMLGEHVVQRFEGRLPFLLKVLSAAQALSIQLHPNKKQAEVLHKKDPKNYPDDNHKPEIAIAVDALTAVAGFRSAVQIKKNFEKYNELKSYIGEKNYNELINCTDENELRGRIKSIYTVVMQAAGERMKLESVIQSLVKRFEEINSPSIEEEQFLIQQKLYGNDVGLLSFFFFNIIQLKPGQAIFTDAGVPHAYIKGNIIECMANSDNVVRAGLTPKFKDVDTLLEIMDYTCGEFSMINKEQKTGEVVYKTSAKEFEVRSYQSKAGMKYQFVADDKPIVVLVEKGELLVEWKDSEGNKSESFVKGDSFICPALLAEFTLSLTEDSKYYIIVIPD
jgi:mannose-6-phosphate isomerase